LASTCMTRRRDRGLLHRGWRITRIELPPRDDAGARQRSHPGQCAVAFIVTELEQAAAAENAEKQRQQCATPRAAYTRLFQTTCRMTEYCRRRTRQLVAMATPLENVLARRDS